MGHASEIRDSQAFYFHVAMSPAELVSHVTPILVTYRKIGLVTRKD